MIALRTFASAPWARPALSIAALGGVAVVLAACDPRALIAQRIALDAGARPRASDAHGSTSQPMTRCDPVRSREPAEDVERTCGPELADCLESVADEGECYAEEPPECDACLRDAYLACATANGCDAALGALECCVRALCAESDGACVARLVAPGGSCSLESQSLDDCAERAAASGGPCERWSDACWSVLPSRLCYGEASTTGRWRGVSLGARTAFSFEHDGALQVLFARDPLPSLRAGQRLPLVRLHPVEGVASYGPRSRRARCAIVEPEIGGLAPVEELACEVEIHELTFASSPRVCDGRIRGAFRAISGTDVLGGTFDAPLYVAREELGAEGCSPSNAPCAEGLDCCSGTCSPDLGLCF